ncbi:heparinase II/III domain-containing protein [Puniceicoccus vermicola]|uniref:Heparinase II/III family protein n=1 Tax=Puniceicoccus vermicola TaxID=388746 RepID=A0A7X1E4Z3_9BACT|nr:heparinase II/III family protein [Puniceicoccus vermicola]MBC2602631.1 heparinase II/III family protein [Puniceicoccus vermicola]
MEKIIPILALCLGTILTQQSTGCTGDATEGPKTANPTPSRPQASEDSFFATGKQPHLFVHSPQQWELLQTRLNKEPYASEIARLRTSLEARMDRFDWEQDTEPRPNNAMSDLRPAGDFIAALSFLYRLEQREEDLEALLETVNYVLNLPAWGVHKYGGPNVDLAGAHVMFGLSLAYDWCGPDLPSEVTATIQEELLARATQMAEFVNGKGLPGYQNNHNALRLLGLISVGVSLRNEDPRAQAIIHKAMEVAAPTFEALSHTDGFFAAEGVPYWQYGLSALVPIGVIAKENLGIDWFRGNQGLENVPLAQAYFLLPPESRLVETNSAGLTRPRLDVLNFGDGPSKSWHDYTKYMTYLAREYRSGLAQWLSDENRRNITGHNPLTRFLGLIWYDPKVQPQSPENLPTQHWFKEQGIFLWRSSWTGNGTVIGIKSTPPGGRFTTETYPFNPGSSHSQPDAGTFLVFGNRSWLIAPPGYTKDRQTSYANTLLVNGNSQIGSNDNWLHTDAYAREKRFPRIVSVDTNHQITRIQCDLTPAYRDPGLIRCTRTFYLVDATTWIIIDEIHHQSPATAEAIFHSESSFFLTDSLHARTSVGDSEFNVTMLPLEKTDASLIVKEQIEWMKKEGKIRKNVLTVQAQPGTQLKWATLFQLVNPKDMSGQLTLDASTGSVIYEKNGHSEILD